MWLVWLCASCFIAGYCIGETVRLMQEIRKYRKAKRDLQRVSFLGCTGKDNEGFLIAEKPCDTWGRIAQVRWVGGETSHVRYSDLVFVEGK